MPGLYLAPQFGEVAGLLQGLLGRPPRALQVGSSVGRSRSERFGSRIWWHRVVIGGVRVKRSVCIEIFLLSQLQMSFRVKYFDRIYRLNSLHWMKYKNGVLQNIYILVSNI